MISKRLRSPEGKEVFVDMEANTIPLVESQIELLEKNGLAYSETRRKFTERLNKMKEQK